MNLTQDAIRKTKVKLHSNCESCGDATDNLKTDKHPDHTSVLARLRKIKGQIIGIEKMIQDQRYCVDILVQFRALSAGLNAVEMTIFKKHIESCVQAAFESKNKTKMQEKITELMELVSKRI